METHTTICDKCSKPFNHGTTYARRGEQSKYAFCSPQCLHDFQRTSITVPCGWCSNPLTKWQHEIKGSSSGKTFCNRSCSASFNNTQRRKSRRSKAEKKLFEILVSAFPDLEIIANDKTMLDGFEADIAIPSISLCVEWNGIVHYQPIYGQDKLSKIQSNDASKRKVAKRKGIDLIVVPDLVSTDAYIREASLRIIEIINSTRQKTA